MDVSGLTDQQLEQNIQTLRQLIEVGSSDAKLPGRLKLLEHELQARRMVAALGDAQLQATLARCDSPQLRGDARSLVLVRLIEAEMGRRGLVAGAVDESAETSDSDFADADEELLAAVSTASVRPARRRKKSSPMASVLMTCAVVAGVVIGLYFLLETRIDSVLKDKNQPTADNTTPTPKSKTAGKDNQFVDAAVVAPLPAAIAVATPETPGIPGAPAEDGMDFNISPDSALATARSAKIKTGSRFGKDEGTLEDTKIADLPEDPAVIAARMEAERIKAEQEAEKKEAARIAELRKNWLNLTPVVADVKASASNVDKIVQAMWKRENVKPRQKIDDVAFMRRAYLDVVGRIPVFDEAEDFIKSQDPKKRQKLIEKLVDSEGFVSHSFNLWADQLRMETHSTKDPRGDYARWLKTAIRKNMPYDKMVYELLTSGGNVTRDNGAAGYYLRDEDQINELVSNTSQVFLGIQIGCAQCHDHAFDKWTQHDFYRMASFWSEVETNPKIDYGMSGRNQDVRAEFAKAFADEDERARAMQRYQRWVRDATMTTYENKGRQLRLPREYKYEDGKPNQVVTRRVLFGKTVEMLPDETPRQFIARWITSKDNPMFAKVAVNRIWSQLMGYPIAETVDNWTDRTKVIDEELMHYLTQELIAGNFDLKRFYKVLLNSDVYLLDSAGPFIEQKDYKAQAYVVRRMSSEQIWDSFVSLVNPDPDSYVAPLGERDGRYDGDIPAISVLTVDPTNVELGVTLAKLGTPNDDQIRKEAQKNPTLKQAHDKASAAMEDEYGEVRSLDEWYEKGRAKNRRKGAPADPKAAQAEMKQNQQIIRMARASNVKSPQPPGSFLREFGQSPRISVGGSRSEPTVPQVLTLLNGMVANVLLNPHTALRHNMAEAGSARDRVRVAYLSILSRYPSSAEYTIGMREINANKDEGYQNLIWALVNSREFIFQH